MLRWIVAFGAFVVAAGAAAEMEEKVKAHRRFPWVIAAFLGAAGAVPALAQAHQPGYGCSEHDGDEYFCNNDPDYDCFFDRSTRICQRDLGPAYDCRTNDGLRDWCRRYRGCRFDPSTRACRRVQG